MDNHTLIEDINIALNWIIECFKTINIILNFSLESLKEIDKFFDDNIKNGKPKLFSVLNKNYGRIVFALGCYLGETIKRNSLMGIWITDDNDSNGEINIRLEINKEENIFPVQRIMKRIKEAPSNSLYEYAYLIINDNHSQHNV